MIALHFSAYAYLAVRTPDSSIISKPIGESFGDALKKEKESTRKTWSLRAITFPGSLFVDSTRVLSEPFEINLDRARQLDKLPQRRPVSFIWKELQKRRIEGESLPDFVLGEIAFTLNTGSNTGGTSVGISIWDEERQRPIEEIILPICVAESTRECPRAVSADSLAGPGLLELATEQSREGTPDASLHIFEMSDRVVGVFYEKPRPGVLTSGIYYPWTVSRSPQEFREALRRQQELFSTQSNKSFVGEDLVSMLFAGDRNAQVAFHQIGSFFEEHHQEKPFESANPPRLFVRMVLAEDGAVDRIVAFPVGL
ncbi:MAG: hypothetical protein HC897_05185 [Thermoanaerobaculia bacterium]|nr:hypothetical protein [Thermoanaerobaculia bacterium]